MSHMRYTQWCRWSGCHTWDNRMKWKWEEIITITTIIIIMILNNPYVAGTLPRPHLTSAWSFVVMTATCTTIKVCRQKVHGKITGWVYTRGGHGDTWGSCKGPTPEWRMELPPPCFISGVCNPTKMMITSSKFGQKGNDYSFKVLPEVCVGWGSDLHEILPTK